MWDHTKDTFPRKPLFPKMASLSRGRAASQQLSRGSCFTQGLVSSPLLCSDSKNPRFRCGQTVLSCDPWLSQNYRCHLAQRKRKFPFVRALCSLKRRLTSLDITKAFILDHPVCHIARRHSQDEFTTEHYPERVRW